MQCPIDGETLSVYVDGELTPSQAMAVMEHVAGCASCRARLAELRQAVNLVRAVQEAMPPAGLRARVAAQLAGARPLSCAQVGQQVDAHLEGQLERAAASAVQQHLDGCPGCRERYQLHQETVAALRALPLVEPPASVRSRVYAQTSRRARRPQPSWRSITGTIGLAAAAAALLLTLRGPQMQAPGSPGAPVPADKVAVSEAPAAAPMRVTVAAPAPTLANTVRRGVQQVSRMLAYRRAEALAPAPAKATPPAAPAPVTEAVATMDTTTPAQEPAVAANAPTSEAPATPAELEPVPAPVIASAQPTIIIERAAGEVVHSQRAPAEVIQLARNEPRPVEVKAFKVEF